MTTNKLLKSFFITALILSAGVARAQEKLSEAEKAKKAAESYALAAPGPEHQRLQSLVGRWDQEIKVWSEPGKTPMTLKATCENKMILGGRFLVSESKGNMGGMSVESTHITGFDRRHKKYTTIGLDTFGTYYVTAAGPYDESKQAVVMYGEDVDPLLGTQKYDFILRVPGPDKYIIEIVFKDKEHTRGAEEFKEVEITYTRTK
jgi:hypothetical protein